MHFKKRLLITGAGGAAAVSFIKATPGHDHFACDIDPHAAGLYLVPAMRRFLVPKADDTEFVDCLLSYCREHRIDVLVPTVDDELLPIARRRDEFESAGTRLLLSEVECLERCLDKWALYQALARSEYVPQSGLLDETFVGSDWPLPFIVKPRVGSGSRGVRLIKSLEELVSEPRDGSLIVQQYLPGPEYSVDVMIDRKGTAMAVVPRERLKVDSGIAVTAWTIRHPLLQSLSQLIAGAVGCGPVANLQFRLDEHGTPKLLEINPRFPGTMSLTVMSGVNMPSLAIRDLLGHYVDPREFLFEETAIVRTWHESRVDPVQLCIMKSKRDNQSLHEMAA